MADMDFKGKIIPNQSTGFYASDDQISDYESLGTKERPLSYNEAVLNPVSGAFFRLNPIQETDVVNNGNDLMVRSRGLLELTDGNKASFVDKFREGSYLQITQDDPLRNKVFRTSWSILENSVYDILVGEIGFDETIQETAIKNLKICPSNISLAGAEVELVSMMSREQRLKTKLDVIKDQYDYILIDCPPSLGLITLNAFTASDSVLIPVQCEYFALEGLGQLLNTVNLVKKHLNKNLEIEGALLTMYDARTNLSNQVVKEVKKYFENKVYKTVIPRNVRLSEAPSYGMPISIYDARSKGAKAYDKLTKEFLKNNA